MNDHNSWRRVAIGAGLVALILAVYFFTYNGYAFSDDEWFLFDATESLARRGDMRLNYQYDAQPPISLAQVQPPVADVEPLQPVLAAPLFLIAQALPGIGLAHTVWIFNILVSAFTAGVVYAYGLALGYRTHVSAPVALVFALGTITWPYSRTFFREPLFTLLALLSAYLAVRLRQGWTAGRFSLPTLAALVAVAAGMVFSKEAALLFLPVLLVELVPSRRLPISRRMVVILAALAVVGAALLLVLLNADALFGLSSRYAFVPRLQQARRNVAEMFEGVAGYMFSPARSMWLFSPVLLLGFFGWPRLIREHRWRQIVAPLVMLVMFVSGYAVVRGPEWYGGSGWGARYLVPVIPFVALWLLPVTGTLMARGATWWARLGAGIVVIFSAAVQIVALLVPTRLYFDLLGAQNPPVIPWQEGVWSLRWSPLRVHLDLLGDQTVDLAWAYAAGEESWLLPVGCVLLAALALAWLGWWIKHRAGTRRTSAIALGSLTLVTILVLGIGLYAIRRDPRYYGDYQPARDLLEQLDEQVRADDVIVLNDYTYTEFFMNTYKRAQPVVLTLPQSPGERYSPEQRPDVESPNPEVLIHRSNTLTLGYLAEQYDRLWLVINSSRFIPWSVRPVESYLSRHYFPVSDIQSTDTTRAILFDLTPAPLPSVWPAQPINAIIGDSLRLHGADIPGGVVRPPGDVLPVSLLWEALAPVPQDYTVALLLLPPGGQPVAQRDSYPANFFDPTQAWRPGSFHRDNHGILLPANLAPGEYDLWLVVYWWQAPADRLPVTSADGENLGDHVLLATVTIQ